MGKYIFPFPHMAVVTDSGRDPSVIRIPSHPPPEHGSLILQATIGCPWNRCLFCGSRKNRKFIPRSEQVKKDISLAKKHYGDKPRRVFLSGGNSLVLRTSRLIEIINFCFQAFPKLERVSIYGSARFIIRKGVDDLNSLSQAGLKKIYVGLETGDDELLKFMEKGATSEEMVKAAEIVRNAGIVLSITVLMGLGGAGTWKRSAEMTSRVLNRMRPLETRLHHLILHRNSPLYELAKKKEFKEASRREILKEMRELVSLLEYETSLHTHRFIIRGSPLERRMPEERERILRILNFALNHFFGEAVDPESIKGYTVRDIYDWDGYEGPPFIDYDDIL